MNSEFLKFTPTLLIFLVCYPAIVSRLTSAYTSIWNKCFVGRFSDPNRDTLFISYHRSLVSMNGEKGLSSDSPWEILIYTGQIMEECIVREDLTLTFPEVCVPECVTHEITAIDSRTGGDEVVIHFIFPGTDTEEHISDSSDFVELNFTYIREGNVFSKMIAAERN